MEDSSLYRPALPYGGTLCDTTVAGRDRGEESIHVIHNMINSII